MLFQRRCDPGCTTGPRRLSLLDDEGGVVRGRRQTWKKCPKFQVGDAFFNGAIARTKSCRHQSGAHVVRRAVQSSRKKKHKALQAEKETQGAARAKDQKAKAALAAAEGE